MCKISLILCIKMVVRQKFFRSSENSIKGYSIKNEGVWKTSPPSQSEMYYQRTFTASFLFCIMKIGPFLAEIWCKYELDTFDFECVPKLVSKLRYQFKATIQFKKMFGLIVIMKHGHLFCNLNFSHILLIFFNKMVVKPLFMEVQTILLSALYPSSHHQNSDNYNTV